MICLLPACSLYCANTVKTSGTTSPEKILCANNRSSKDSLERSPAACHRQTNSATVPLKKRIKYLRTGSLYAFSVNNFQAKHNILSSGTAEASWNACSEIVCNLFIGIPSKPNCKIPSIAFAKHSHQAQYSIMRPLSPASTVVQSSCSNASSKRPRSPRW